MGVQYDYSYRGNLGEFIRRVGRIPNLARDEELSLIKAYQEHRDPKALSSLYAAHQKLIVQLIRKAKLTGRFGDALSEANLGLHTAIEKFEAEKGVRLNTYAKWWINAALSEMYGKNSIVKLGASGDDKKARIHLKDVLNKVVGPGKEPSQQDYEEMAKRLQVSLTSVQKAYYGVHIGDLSIDGAFGKDGGDFSGLHETLPDHAPLAEEVVEEQDEIEDRRSHLKRAMEYLDERELYIFSARRLEEPPRTLEDMSYEFNISRERVRQIEVKAYDKVVKVVHDGPSLKMVKEREKRRQPATPETAPA